MRFKIIFSNGFSSIVDKVIAIQDGQEKQLAFHDMKYSPDFRVIEYDEDAP